MAEIDDLRQAAAAKLDAQAGRSMTYQQYFDNEAGIIALLDTDERRTFRTFLAEAGANWCELVVNAVAQRLQVVGFRFGDQTASDAAWTLWQANSLDADAEMVQTDALVTGQGLLLVQPDDDNPTGVCITVESPMQATVLYEPGNRRRRVAGYKRYSLDPWLDGFPVMAGGSVVEVLMTPDQIVTWWPGAERSAPQIERNPAGVVGMVEVVPQPRTMGPPRSELTSAAPIQDRINTTIFNRLVAIDFAAFRQIWATGVRIAQQVIKGDDGTTVTRVTAPFQVGANRLLTNEDPAGRFGVIPESMLTGYLASVEQDVSHLAAITQTPPSYVLGTMVNLSADAITAAESGLVAKCGRRARHIGEGYEEAMRIALALTGNPGAADTSAEVIWAPFQTQNLAQTADAAVKMATVGVPEPALWRRLGATEQEIEQWTQAQQDNPAPTPPPPAPLPEPAPIGA